MRVLAIVHQADAGAGVFGEVAARVPGTSSSSGSPPTEARRRARRRSAPRWSSAAPCTRTRRTPTPGCAERRSCCASCSAAACRCSGCASAAQLLAEAAGAAPRRASRAGDRLGGDRADRRGADPTRCSAPLPRALRGLRVAQLRGAAARGRRGPGPQPGVPSGLPAGDGSPRLGHPVPRRGHERRGRTPGSTPRTATRTRCGSGSTPRRLRAETLGRLDGLERARAGHREPLPRGGRPRARSLRGDVGGRDARRPP